MMSFSLFPTLILTHQWLASCVAPVYFWGRNTYLFSTKRIFLTWDGTPLIPHLKTRLKHENSCKFATIPNIETRFTYETGCWTYRELKMALKLQKCVGYAMYTSGNMSSGNKRVMRPNKIFWTQDCEKTIATRQKLKNTSERKDEILSKYIFFYCFSKLFPIYFSSSTTLNGCVSAAFSYREETMGLPAGDQRC